jgi:hypothetical protein
MNREFTRYQKLPSVESQLTLTPALSHGERENPSPISSQVNVYSQPLFPPHEPERR